MTLDIDYLDDISLTPTQDKALREQRITEDRPGTIPRDFAILLDFIGSAGVDVGAKGELLTQRSLVALNERLMQPIDVRLKRPVQKSYPPIQGLYLLLRASGLGTVRVAGGKKRIAVNPQVLESWRGLTVTERYFSLLETWVLKGHGEIVGEGRSSWETPLVACIAFWGRLGRGELSLVGNNLLQQSIGYCPRWYNLALMHLFGLVSLASDKPLDGQGWQVKSVRKTPWGDALMALLDRFSRSREYMALRWPDRMEEPLGAFASELKPYFPDLAHSLSRPTRQIQDGVYLFKASLGKVWRRIAISGRNSFDDLADAVLDAFELDDEHLYQFRYRNVFGMRVEIEDPRTEEPPSAAKTRIGDQGIEPGARLTFLYDFGNTWELGLVLEGIEPEDEGLRRPQLRGESGDAPSQYPDWDEV